MTIALLYFIHYYISYCKNKICQAKFSSFLKRGSIMYKRI